MFKRYATATVVGAEIARRDAFGLVKTSHRAVFNYEPREGFLYVRSRMISSRCNDNHDEFPADEIRKAWKTAVGKPVFVNHANEDHRRMRGVIVDAALHEDTLPDGRPDVWIEALHEIDARRFPKLAEAILAGRVNRTSMGTDVGFSVCSACGNKASTPAEYCDHIPRMKGKILYRHTASGEREGHLIREICYKLGFFENSFLVEDPADPTAVVTGIDDRGLKATAGLFSRKPVDWQIDPDRKVQDLGNNFHLLNHLATEHGWGHDAFQSAGKEGFRAAHDRLHSEGVPGMTDDEGMHFHASLSSLPSIEAVRYEKPTDHPFFQDTKLSPKHIVAAYDEADEPTKAQGMRWYSDAHHIAKSLDPDGDAHRGAGVLAAYSPRTAWPINLFNASNTLRNRRAVRIGEGMNVMGQHAKSAAKLVEDNKHYFQVFSTPKITDFAHLIAHGGDDEACPTCKPHRKDDYPKQAVVVDRHALSVAAGRRMNDNDLGRAPLGTRRFYEHVADQYRKAAKQISNRDGTTVHPHQLQAITWLQQQKRNAAADEGESFGGRGRQTRDRNAWSAWEQHATDTHPGLMGEEGNIHLRNPHRKESSLPSVLAEIHPETGCPSCGNSEDFNAIGAVGVCQNCGETFDTRKSMEQNMTDRRFQENLAEERRAREKSDEAAFKHVTPNRTVPHPGSPPTLPGIANDILRPERMRKNGPIPGVPKGDQIHDRQELMISRSRPHRLPEGPAQLRSLNSLPTLPRLAYGETKAPQDVDTLRTESCPVCGEMDAFDGDRCQVCNFIQPPAMFTDPDTGVARQMDLKKDTLDQQNQVGPDGQPIPGQDEVDPNDPTGENQPMTDMPGQAQDQIADLFCPACGFSADTQEPMTNNDPSMPPEQQGLVEGDVCPNCGNATMLSPNDVGEMGGEVPQEVADDANANGIPDDQEQDVDEDGIPDTDEPDTDNDGKPDDAERDSDDDGVPDDADPDDEDPTVPDPDAGQDEEGDEDAGPVEDEDEAPKGRKDKRAALR